jgi:hypothetical protein
MTTYHVTYRGLATGKIDTVAHAGETILEIIRDSVMLELVCAIPTSGPKPYTPPAQLPPAKLFSQDTLHPATCPKRYGGRRNGAITQDETADIDNTPPIGRVIDGVADNRHVKRNDLVAIQCGIPTAEIMKRANPKM